ncbi:MAG: hypothetical protein M5R36_11330 [Deltaproteobacteria bacterium]|nr:hypothetical protein [Deltaproteobacteria bacterium]
MTALRRSVVVLLLLAAAACARPVQVAPPYKLVEAHPPEPPLDVAVAIVRPASLVEPGRDFDNELAARLDSALLQGFVDATRSIAARAVLVDRAPASGFDYVVLPSNFYYSRGGGMLVSMSMDVHVRRTADGREFALLIEGESGPGPRPVVAWENGGRTLHLTGAYLHNEAYGQALNNALFHLTWDYAKKCRAAWRSFRSRC